MKKILLSFSLLVAVFSTKAQTVFNEFYTDPGSGKHEFFELYNTAPGPENLNCYTLLTWFKDGSTTGFYVLDFPDSTIDSKRFFIVAAKDPFNVQAKTGVNAAFDWNTLNFVGSSGSLKKYTRNGSGYDILDIPPPAGFNDIFHTNTGTPAAYAMFLFKNNTLVNGFLGGHNSTDVPSDITTMPNLTSPIIGGACGGNLVVNWASVTKAENTTANGGSDNGFIRNFDGKCGSWVKSSSQVQHTPGTSNGSAATTSTDDIVTREIYGGCPNSANGSVTLKVDVTDLNGNLASDIFPIEIQLYFDNAPFGVEIGGNDPYQSSLQQDALSDPAVQFTITPATQKVWIVYKSILGCYEKTVVVVNSCATLPVKFKSFTATRSNSTNVSVKWETASEQNSAGFAVERNVRGTWEQVAYIPSQAVGGNSNSALTYQLNDLNATRGISQYRIRQDDIDGAAKLSDIRSVRGEGQKGSTIVYPNPTDNGKVNIVFEGSEITKRNISVQDMSGRIVKQWNNYSNNNIQIENLSPGFYTVRIVDIGTGEQSVEKVVVNKR